MRTCVFTFSAYDLVSFMVLPFFAQTSCFNFILPNMHASYFFSCSQCWMRLACSFSSLIHSKSSISFFWRPSIMWENLVEMYWYGLANKVFRSSEIKVLRFVRGCVRLCESRVCVGRLQSPSDLLSARCKRCLETLVGSQ